MSRDSMNAMLEVSKYYPLLIRDDPYFTGLVAEKAKVDLYNVEWVDFYQVFAFRFNISMISTRTLLMHNATETQWLTAWAKMIKSYDLNSLDGEELKITFSPSRTKLRKETQYYALEGHVPGECSKPNKTDVPKQITIAL